MGESQGRAVQLRRILAGCGEYNFSGRPVAATPDPARLKFSRFKESFFWKGGMRGKSQEWVAERRERKLS